MYGDNSYNQYGQQAGMAPPAGGAQAGAGGQYVSPADFLSLPNLAPAQGQYGGMQGSQYPTPAPIYAPQQPAYPMQQPAYPMQQPAYPMQQPVYAPQQPMQQPAYPMQPVQPVQPAYPMQPVQPAYPMQPMQPAYPVAPVVAAAPMGVAMARAPVYYMFGLSCRNLDRKDLFSKSDPFMVISAFRSGPHDLVMLHRTETLMNNKNPTFQPFQLDLMQLCRGNLDQQFRVEVTRLMRTGGGFVLCFVCFCFFLSLL
jgi:hypothetical protein